MSLLFISHDCCFWRSSKTYKGPVCQDNKNTASSTAVSLELLLRKASCCFASQRWKLLRMPAGMLGCRVREAIPCSMCSIISLLLLHVNRNGFFCILKLDVMSGADWNLSFLYWNSRNTSSQKQEWTLSQNEKWFSQFPGKAKVWGERNKAAV